MFKMKILILFVAEAVPGLRVWVGAGVDVDAKTRPVPNAPDHDETPKFPTPALVAAVERSNNPRGPALAVEPA